MDPSLPPSPASGSSSPREVVDDLADRFGASPIAVVAGLVCGAVALVVGVFLVLGPDRSDPPELSIPYAASASDDGASPSTTATTGAVDLVAHAAGAVARPGVYALPPGSRVGDLLTAAGGPVGDADVDRLNLAAPLDDGARVYVPRSGEVQPPPVLGPDLDDDPGQDGPIDLNRATEDELERLPGIGPATASAIVDHRERYGPFASVDDLLDVRGIGDAKLAALRELVTV